MKPHRAKNQYAFIYLLPTPDIYQVSSLILTIRSYPVDKTSEKQHTQLFLKKYLLKFITKLAHSVSANTYGNVEYQTIYYDEFCAKSKDKKTYF